MPDRIPFASPPGEPPRSTTTVVERGEPGDPWISVASGTSIADPATRTESTWGAQSPRSFSLPRAGWMNRY